jgi:multicomponent Na+:H+ antiporter subunit F
MLANLKEVILIVSLIILALCLVLCFVRTLIGPSIPDRIVAINMIGTQVIIIICILSVLMNSSGLVDMAIIYAMFSFLAVVLFTRLYIGVYNEKHIKKEDEENA